MKVNKDISPHITCISKYKFCILYFKFELSLHFSFEGTEEEPPPKNLVSNLVGKNQNAFQRAV